jgi:soluble lytic murein transglycosylase-like protein
LRGDYGQLRRGEIDDYPGNPGLNIDGSEDLGLMQVNTRWVGPLARFVRMTEPNVRDRLIADPCFNIAAAAAIMRTYLVETRGDLMLAVGNYHSHTPALNQRYQAQVLRSAWGLFGLRTASARQSGSR